jgi:hypothetical protein
MILAIVLAVPCFGGNLDKKLPALEGLVGYGCAVKGPIWQIDHNHPSGRNVKVWRVSFSAEHKDIISGKAEKNWKLFYAYRKSRMKGLVDCDRFMGRVARALKKRRTK